MRAIAAKFTGRIASTLFALALSWVALPGIASAQNAVNRLGLFVTVPSPLSSDAITRIKKQVDDARNRGEQRPAVVIFDFNPNNQDVTSEDFGVCFNLARYISNLHDVTTVGFVHARLGGHLNLPALACKELVMSSSAQIGNILPAGETKLSSTEANGYEEILVQSRAAQLAVVRKMYDPQVQLRKGRKDGADWYFDLRDRKTVEKQGVQVTDTRAPGSAPDGRIGSFNGSQARELGLARVIAEDRNSLAEIYSLSATSLRESPLGAREPVAYRYMLRGPINPGVRESVNRVARKVLSQDGNMLFLVLDDCGDGDLQAARELAEDLITLEKESGLFSVAFVPNNAPDTAAVVALGCSEIVMSRRADLSSAEGEAPEARFGDFEDYLNRGRGRTENIDVDTWVSSLRDLAEKQGYPPLLIEGMLNRDLEIIRARSKTDRARSRLMTEEEFSEQKADWDSDGVIKAKGQLLTLTASRAQELGMVRLVVANRDTDDVLKQYGLDPSQVRDATPAWLDQFAAFLKQPSVTLLLVVIAFAGLMLELKVPGTAIPGIISALCFILVFWSQTQFSGQLMILAGLLFILGLFLVLIEIFVLPGFGAAGVMGLILILGSMALLTMDQIPQSGADWMQFFSKFGQYMVALLVAVLAVAWVSRYLPNIPYANRLMLPAPEDEAEMESSLPGATLAASLLGAVGTAVTVLRPAGTVRFGDQFVDVVSEGGYIPAGGKVQVVEVEGNRIVVKEV